MDEYISGFPKETQEKLKSIRALIKKEVPNGEEVISYGIPTIKLNGKYVVYFAGFKTHISVYPTIFGMDEAIPEILPYKKGKGTAHFPIDKPLPLPLIRKMVKFLLKENIARTKK